MFQHRMIKITNKNYK